MPVLIVSREHLPPRRLLEEALDRAVLAGDDDAELERVLDRGETDRRRRARDRGGTASTLVEVDVGEDVAGDDEERARRAVSRALPTLPAVPSGTGSSAYVIVDAELAAVAEVGLDVVGEERDRDDDLVEPVLLEQRDDVLHHRPVGERAASAWARSR